MEMKSARGRISSSVLDEFDLHRPRAAGGEVGVVRQHAHPEGDGAPGEFAADAAHAQDGERLAVEFDALELLALPFPGGTTEALRLRDRPRDGDEQGKGVFSGGNRVAVGRVHHNDARAPWRLPRPRCPRRRPRGRRPGARFGGFEHALVHLGLRAHDERGAVGDDFQELVFLEAGLENHVENAVPLEVFHAAR